MLTECVTAHQEVWTGIREALSWEGWRNYSLFLRPGDGTVIGYFESDDVVAAQDAIALDAVSPRWEAAMSEYFAPGGGEKQILPQYFHLA